MKKIEYNLDQVAQVVAQCLADFKKSQIVTFTGGLGAGKTTFIKQLVAQLGSTDVVTSPTFTYFNIYNGNNDLIIYHFDAYRLSSLQEFEEAGFFEYLYQPNSIVLIEWPEILNEVLKKSVCKVEISVGLSNNRVLEYQNM